MIHPRTGTWFSTPDTRMAPSMTHGLTSPSLANTMKL
jgi:hypothetical protein